MTPDNPRIIALATRSRSAPPLVMVTAYDHPSARIADAAGVDLILVGDSAATVMLGYPTTRGISIDELLMLTRAARRGTERALLVGDLPFGSYEDTDEHAVATARRFAEAGCDLVKVEGAAALSRVRSIIGSGIAVVGHVGLLPQGAASAADLKARGRSADEAMEIVRDAVTLAESGCSALVVEAVPSVVAESIVERITIPVIGIGAGSTVGGQVLVYHDVLGLGEGHVPKFVRPYASLRADSVRAIEAFARDVRARAYPSRAEEYGMPDEERDQFLAAL